MSAERRYPYEASLTSAEILAIGVAEFLPAVADHLNQPFEVIEQMFHRVPFNLWHMIETPDGFSALALLLSPADSGLPLLRPTVH